ncbi:MAG: hypothetical protein LBQ73_10840, partial [Tannerellaceae bacterium]|nr:hypothetical protein [Tannerellaceae bacterium]
AAARSIRTYIFAFEIILFFSYEFNYSYLNQIIGCKSIACPMESQYRYDGIFSVTSFWHRLR